METTLVCALLAGRVANAGPEPPQHSASAE